MSVRRMSTSTLLSCFIEGEDIIFPLTVVCNDLVGDLKESIQSERALGSLI